MISQHGTAIPVSSDSYLPAWVWRDRALKAEQQAAEAMECLRLLCNGSIPEPWRTVILCAYLGCGGAMPTGSASARGGEG